jgi:hypothetical protein
LDLDLRHLERAKCDISKDLCRCGTSEPDGRLVFVRKLLASQVHVLVLEHFIKTVLEHAL